MFSFCLVSDIKLVNENKINIALEIINSEKSRLSRCIQEFLK